MKDGIRTREFLQRVVDGGGQLGEPRNVERIALAGKRAGRGVPCDAALLRATKRL